MFNGVIDCTNIYCGQFKGFESNILPKMAINWHKIGQMPLWHKNIGLILSCKIIFRLLQFSSIRINLTQIERNGSAVSLYYYSNLYVITGIDS